jgi:hypothetical protein
MDRFRGRNCKNNASVRHLGSADVKEYAERAQIIFALFKKFSVKQSRYNS